MSKPDSSRYESDTLIQPSDGESSQAAEKRARTEGETPASFGRYAVQSVLGEGAFGRAYLGFDSQLNRYVAIKVAHMRQSSGQVEQEFLIEARQLAQLKHPGIVAVYDVGVQGDQCYIVSDYLQGESLHAWLQANQLSWQQAVHIVAT